ETEREELAHDPAQFRRMPRGVSSGYIEFPYKQTNKQTDRQTDRLTD
ncbi:hypothetical protein V3C99_008732, partial [Haemonchus contortus]